MFIKLTAWNHRDEGTRVALVNMGMVSRVEQQDGRSALVYHDRSPLFVCETLLEISNLLGGAVAERVG